MRVLVHDYSGHPFQVELSRELAARGHQVTHSHCEAHVSGRGDLDAPRPGLRFESIGQGLVVEKLAFRKRLFQELRFGFELAAQVRRLRPDVVLVGNTPIPMMLVFTAIFALRRQRWVMWQQDIQSIAAHSFADGKLHPAFRLVGLAMGIVERWCARRADRIVVIAASFRRVHENWGTAGKVAVIPNWAPLDEIVPVERKNDWAVEQRIEDTMTLLYSGTLGLKHNPALLVGLAREVRGRGQDVHLVVVTEGPAVPVLREEAARHDVPLTLLPFQPYDRLPEVLGSGDILIVLLEQSAGEFSVPSKTLSYLCAGRPVLGLMPAENLAAELINRAGGCVLPPTEAALPRAAEWVSTLLDDLPELEELGLAARDLAEQEFALARCADRFERILADARGQGRRGLRP
jgi:putative colanic acid biosynthesis glycosyltransferase WcaI